MSSVADPPAGINNGRNVSGDGAAREIRLAPLLSVMLLANVALYALWQGILQVLLPMQVQAIDPGNKVSNLAIIVTINGAISLVGSPIGGAVSDRTKSRFGRRTPWLVPSAILTATLAILMGQMHAIKPLVIVFTLTWFFGNFHCGPLTAIFADRIPEARRGISSSIVGLGIPLGILIGVNFASRVSSTTAYTGLALFLVMGSLLLAIVMRERPYFLSSRKDMTNRETSREYGFFSAFRMANYRYVFASRFCMYLAYYMVNGYLLFTLQDRVGVQNVPGGNAAIGVGILASINTAAWIIVSLFIGQLADHLNRRRLFVVLTAFGLAATLIVPVLLPTWTGMIVYSVLVGAFKGAYLAVDLALMSLVLPDRDNQGRDLGILNTGAGASQLLSGSLAGLLILFAGGYDAMFVAAAAISLASAFCGLQIKGIR